jgi:hypothetical protein
MAFRFACGKKGIAAEINQPAVSCFKGVKTARRVELVEIFDLWSLIWYGKVKGHRSVLNGSESWSGFFKFNEILFNLVREGKINIGM